MAEYEALLNKTDTSKCAQYADKPIPASVPGEVHKDLLKAGILNNDTLYRLSSIENFWVTMNQQTYETTLQITQEDIEAGAVLKLDKVGTIGTIYLND